MRIILTVWVLLGILTLTGCNPGHEDANDSSAVGVSMQVVSKDERPLAGAVVYWCPRQGVDLAKVREMELKGHGAEAILPVIGRRLCADKSGHVKLPEEEIVALAASYENLWGVVWTPEELPERLVLHPVDLTVRVVDKGGKAVCGVPIEILVSGEDPARLYRGSTTFPDGVLCLRGGDKWMDKKSGPFTVRFGGPLYAGTSQLVSRDKLPTTIELELPPCGQVHVRLRDADGDTPRENFWINIEKEGQQTRTWRNGSKSLLWYLTGEYTKKMKGERRYRFVALNETFKVEVGSTRYKFVDKTISGPTRPGEVIEVDINLGRVLPVLTGRLVDAAGQPWVGVYYSVATTEDREIHAQRGETDIHGGFRYIVRHYKPNPDNPILHVVFDLSGETHLFSFPVPLKLDERHDVGSVALSEDRTVVAGIVVDSRGNPVSGANISVCLAGKNEWGYTYGWPEAWGYPSLNCDSQGRFLVTGGFEKAREVVVHVENHEENDQVQRRPVRCLRGTRNVKVTLEETGTVRASLLVNEGFRDLQPEVLLRSPGILAEADLSSGKEKQIIATWRRLLPGSYQLEIGLSAATNLGVSMPASRWTNQAPLVTIPRILVHPSETSNDPRLVDIDLRNRVRTACIEVRTWKGKLHPFSDRWAWWYLPSGKIVLLSNSRFESVIRVPIVDEQPVNLYVAAVHHRFKKVMGLTKDQTVTLDPGINLTLAIKGIPVGQEIAYVYSTTTDSNPNHGPWGRYGYGFENGVAEIPVSFPGPYTVRVELKPSDITVPTRPAVIEVGLKDQQTFCLEVDPEEYAKALKD